MDEVVHTLGEELTLATLQRHNGGLEPRENPVKMLNVVFELARKDQYVLEVY